MNPSSFFSSLVPNGNRSSSIPNHSSPNNSENTSLLFATRTHQRANGSASSSSSTTTTTSTSMRASTTSSIQASSNSNNDECDFGILFHPSSSAMMHPQEQQRHDARPPPPLQQHHSSPPSLLSPPPSHPHFHGVQSPHVAPSCGLDGHVAITRSNPFEADPPPSYPSPSLARQPQEQPSYPPQRPLENSHFENAQQFQPPPYNAVCMPSPCGGPHQYYYLVKLPTPPPSELYRQTQQPYHVPKTPPPPSSQAQGHVSAPITPSCSMDQTTTSRRQAQSSSTTEPPQTPPPRRRKWKRHVIQVCPGVSLPLRGTQETLHALRRGKVQRVSCLECTAELYCMDTAQHVLCPSCKSISPILDHCGETRGGVGLGFSSYNVQDLLNSDSSEEEQEQDL